MPGGLSSTEPARRDRLTGLDAKGHRLETDAHVTAAVALGETVVTAHGDGALRFFTDDAPLQEVAAHRGAVLAMAAAGPESVVTGGDDGRFLRLSLDGTLEDLAGFDGSWVDCVAADQATGLLACSAGRVVYVWRRGVVSPETFEHPSTVGGLAFDPTGQRLAVAHYGGATIWERGKRHWQSTRLPWAGSHIGITWSPDGRYVVTVMQENALHGWRLRDQANLSMSGYLAKPRALDWVGDVPHLATSGAEQAICWPFDSEDGPMGRSPLCLAHGGMQLVTMVRALPGQPAVLTGFQDGVVVISALDEALESLVLRDWTGSEVTAMAVTDSLSHILIGDGRGSVLWAPLWKRGEHGRPV